MWCKFALMLSMLSLAALSQAGAARADDISGLMENRITITRQKIHSLQGTNPELEKVLEKDLQTMNRWKARRELQSRKNTSVPAAELFEAAEACRDEAFDCGP